MATVTEGTIETFADLLADIGHVPPERIRMKPAPGTAKVKDVIAALEAPRKRICELIDGVLVEKAMGAGESLYAIQLVRLLGGYLEKLDDDLGVLLGEAGTLKFFPRLVRIPDISFISWERVGADEWPKQPVPNIIPDLTVEVISEGNTKGEMDRKLRDYFTAGVREVWYVYPKSENMEVYTDVDQIRRIPKGGTFKNSIVFPDFSLSLPALFNSRRRRKKR